MLASGVRDRDASRMAELRGPFRGSEAIRAALVTRGILRGPRFQQLGVDVFAAAGVPSNLANRSRGIALTLNGSGVLSGYSAAELLGSGCVPGDPSVEVTIPGGDFRERPGLAVHRDLLADDEVTAVEGVAVTTPLRTAWDLARWLPTVEAVVAVDALARVGGFDHARCCGFRNRYPRARWRRRVPGVIDLSDPRAESPMETRSRLVLVLRGLPRPELQFAVYDTAGVFVARLDMAYPRLRLAMEYDGRGHLKQWQQQADAHRANRLDECDWSVLRFTSVDVYGYPDEMFARVHGSVERRSRLLLP